ncbi:MAG: riboflavin kinase [Bacteroidales bacterium]|nr:riboflavin kinase [Deltaproteobacteria bacterium]MBL7137750.1 riboflavin kinase [Bacteroidales bacterium]
MTPLFSISGTVIKGSQLGRKLGYPTANLDLPDASRFYHLTGVYAATVVLEEEIYPGMANIGFRPTLDQLSFTVEVNIFDFNKDIYGQEITIRFLERIRDEIRFTSMEELVTQMAKDETEIRKILSLALKPNTDSQ